MEYFNSMQRLAAQNPYLAQQQAAAFMQQQQMAAYLKQQQMAAFLQAQSQQHLSQQQHQQHHLLKLKQEAFNGTAQQQHHHQQQQQQQLHHHPHELYHQQQLPTPAQPASAPPMPAKYLTPHQRKVAAAANEAGAKKKPKADITHQDVKQHADRFLAMACQQQAAQASAMHHVNSLHAFQMQQQAQVGGLPSGLPVGTLEALQAQMGMAGFGNMAFPGASMPVPKPEPPKPAGRVMLESCPILGDVTTCSGNDISRLLLVWGVTDLRQLGSEFVKYGSIKITIVYPSRGTAALVEYDTLNEAVIAKASVLHYAVQFASDPVEIVVSDRNNRGYTGDSGASTPFSYASSIINSSGQHTPFMDSPSNAPLHPAFGKSVDQIGTMCAKIGDNPLASPEFASLLTDRFSLPMVRSAMSSPFSSGLSSPLVKHKLPPSTVFSAERRKKQLRRTDDDEPEPREKFGRSLTFGLRELAGKPIDEARGAKDDKPALLKKLRASAPAFKPSSAAVQTSAAQDKQEREDRLHTLSQQMAAMGMSSASTSSGLSSAGSCLSSYADSSLAETSSSAHTRSCSISPEERSHVAITLAITPEKHAPEPESAPEVYDFGGVDLD